MKDCATIKICGVTHVRRTYREKGYQLFLVFSRNYYIQKTMITYNYIILIYGKLKEIDPYIIHQLIYFLNGFWICL